ncbi:hypothetical protein Tco_0438065 [Tanacetum coccineum]
MSLSPAISFESLTKQYELLGLSGEDADPQELQEQRKWLLRSGFMEYSLTNRVTLGLVLLRGLDHVNPAIRLPLEHGISRVLGFDDYSNPRTMAGVDINTLTMEQYLSLSRENQAPGVVKPEIKGNTQYHRVYSRSLLLDPLKYGWIDSLQELSTLGTSLKKPLSKGIVHHLRPLNDLKISTTLSKKAMNHYTKLGNGTNSWDDTTQALTAIQTMTDHSQKWHDGTSSRNLSSNSNIDGLAAIVSKLDNLGRDMKKLEENVHAIQVGCQICEGPHLDKECPLNKKVKQLEEVKYGEFGRSAPFNRSNGAKFHVLIIDHQINTRNQSASLKNLETQIEQLTKELKARTTNGTPSSSVVECKVVNNDHETQHRPISSRKLNGKEDWTTKDIQCQLPPKELNLGNFTLPCTIGNFNFYGMTDLGASVNVMHRNTFEYLRLINL